MGYGRDGNSESARTPGGVGARILEVDTELFPNLHADRDAGLHPVPSNLPSLQAEAISRLKMPTHWCASFITVEA